MASPTQVGLIESIIYFLSVLYLDLYLHHNIIYYLMTEIKKLRFRQKKLVFLVN